MAHPDEFVKGMAVGMLRCRRSIRDVAKEINVSHTRVRKWWKRWCAERNVKRKMDQEDQRKQQVY